MSFPTTTAHTLLLTPQGHLLLAPDSEEPPLLAELQHCLAEAFAQGAGHGLLHLGATEIGTVLPPVFAWWRDFSSRYVTLLCATPEDGEMAIAAPDDQVLHALIADAPPMRGAEYLTTEILDTLWSELDIALRVELAAAKCPLQDFLKARHPAWNLVGRVHFNLAENRKDPEAPFAFLATYTSRLSAHGKAQHLPLSQALIEFSDGKNRARLLSLLKPVQSGAAQCSWLREMVDAGEIYHPLRWTPRDAYRSHERTLVPEAVEAERIVEIFHLYADLGNVRTLKYELDQRGWVTAPRKTNARSGGSAPFTRGHLYRILSNPIYLGQIAHKGNRYPGLHPAIVDQNLWDRVQATLSSNRQGRKYRVSAKDPSPLAGLVFDAAGERLTPTHACKGNRRYRYYVSQGLVGRVTTVDSSGQFTGLRIPAQELEGAVRQTLWNYCRDPQRLLTDLVNPDAAEYQALMRRTKQVVETLEHSTTRKRTTLFGKLIERVMVSQNRLEIRLERGELLAEQEEATPIILTVPVSFQRCGFGIRLIVPSQNPIPIGMIDTRLVRLVRRGADWFRRLLTEEDTGPKAIAQTEGVSASLVQRLIYVAFLAPDIVAAIDAGRQPVTLTSDSLIKALPLPACWIEQRRLLGLGSVSV